MKRDSQVLAGRRNQGFSLIELLVSITIGLVIVVAAGSAYLGASAASKVSDAQTRMNEDGQAALNILSQHLRMAGTNPDQSNRDPAFARNPIYASKYVGGEETPYGSVALIAPVPSLSTFSIRGCDGTFTATPATATAISALSCAAGANTLPDSIAISYEADRYNTEPIATGEPTDCIGNKLPSTTAAFPLPAPVGTLSATFSVAVNRFYIATSGSVNAPTLFCKGNGGGTGTSAQPLVENIEDMQFTYGTVSTSETLPTATAAGYLTANGVASETSLAALPLEDRWGKVLSVRICLLVRSESPAAPNAASAKYDDCQGGRDVTAPDLRLRRAYSTTVVLRNRRF